MPVRTPSPHRACSGVPVHPDLAWPRSSRTPARHLEAVTIPPLPSPPVHHSLPTEHRIPRSFFEIGPLSRDSASHQHHLHVPWTQLTVPPRTAAHGTQWRPSPVHHRPMRSVSINTREPSLEASLPLICSTSLPTHLQNLAIT
jgi:hypothetical protein